MEHATNSSFSSATNIPMDALFKIFFSKLLECPISQALYPLCLQDTPDISELPPVTVILILYVLPANFTDTFRGTSHHLVVASTGSSTVS